MRKARLLTMTALAAAMTHSFAHAETLDGAGGTDLLVGAPGPSLVRGLGGDDSVFGEKPAGDGDIASLRVLSRAPGQAVSDGSNGLPAFSPDGTRVAFCSAASNLVPGDTNGGFDLFVKDLLTNRIQRISTTASGAQTSGTCEAPSFSADGNRVVYATSAALDPADTNAQVDVYVKTLGSGAVVRASTRANGSQLSAPSRDGVLSPDGRKVAFRSFSSNLVAGDTNTVADVFLKDLTTGAVTRVSTTDTDAEANGVSGAPAFSPDGGRLVFASEASNLAGGDTNGVADIFVKDIGTGDINRVSTSAAGVQGTGASANPSFSADGKTVLFESAANDLVGGDAAYTDVFVKTLATGEIRRVSTRFGGGSANGNSSKPVFSPDGRKVAFVSYAGNLVAGDRNGVRDIFVKSLDTGAVVRASAPMGGTGGNRSSFDPKFAPDGSAVVFRSLAALTADDTNTSGDVYMAVLSAGESGADRVVGGEGDDLVVGAGGNDALFGTAGRDRLFGGPGNDVLSGGADRDFISGGAGLDTVSYADKAVRVEVRLGGAGRGTAKVGGAVEDVLVGIEHAIGGSGADLLVGDAAANRLVGGAGADGISGGLGNDALFGGLADDRLVGGPGNDVLVGGAGRDTLTGGPGADRFRFIATGDSPAGGFDTIADFRPDLGDRIDLTAIDAIAGTAANDAFRFIGAAPFSGAKGDLRFAGGFLAGDTNGDKVPDIVVRVVVSGSLKATDILR